MSNYENYNRPSLVGVNTLTALILGFGLNTISEIVSKATENSSFLLTGAAISCIIYFTKLRD